MGQQAATEQNWMVIAQERGLELFESGQGSPVPGATLLISGQEVVLALQPPAGNNQDEPTILVLGFPDSTRFGALFETGSEALDALCDPQFVANLILTIRGAIEEVISPSVGEILEAVDLATAESNRASLENWGVTEVVREEE